MLISRPVRLIVVGLLAATGIGSTSLAEGSVQAVTAIGAGHALSSRHPVLRFHGVFHNLAPATVSDPLPAGCLVNCQQWALSVRTRQPFLVSMKNGAASLDDGLNLFVDDPAGQQVASADGIGADGQAVEIAHPTPGVYRVFVTETYAYDASPAYRGEARVMAGRSWRHVKCARRRCPELPRLRARPPSAIHVSDLPPVASTPIGFPLPIDVPTQNSCYVDETAGTGATRCLRFTSEVANVGAGQLQMKLPWIKTAKGSLTSGFLPGECQARQVISWTDGSHTSRAAGPCEFHLEHAHFHYKAFVGYGLYRLRGHGRIGRLVSRSQKESFCLADDDYAGFGKPAPNAARNFAGQPGCNLPHPDGSFGASVEEGLDPGWGDVYTWDTPDQYIDITHVPAGRYVIVIETNPSGLMEVAGRARTCAATTIRLTTTSVAARATRTSVRCPR